MPTSPDAASNTPLLSVAAVVAGSLSDSSRHTWLPMRTRSVNPKSTVWLARSSRGVPSSAEAPVVPSFSPVGSWWSLPSPRLTMPDAHPVDDR